MKPPPRRWYRFGPFRLCPSEGALLRDGELLALSPRTFDTLAFLVKHSPNLVTIDELISGVWDDVSVEPNNVTQHVFSARKTLGDNSQHPIYIQNVPRRGYRFIALVEEYEEENGPGPTPATIPAAAKTKRNYWLIAAFSGAAILMAVLLTAFLPVAAPELEITGYRQLTHDGSQKDGPLLLAKGSQLIYFSTEGSADIWGVPVDGGQAVPLGNQHDERQCDLSADGRSILFSSVDANGTTLWSRPLAGGQASMLAEADMASWSPDGKKMAAASAGSLSILEGRTVIGKLTVAGEAWDPRWSPDGRRIRFGVLRPNEATLWEVKADGSGSHQLKESSVSSMVLNGVWNPAGNLFFFTAHTGGSDNIWVARERQRGLGVEDSRPVPLTNGPGDWRWPVVSQDSKKIFAIHTVSEPQLTSLDPATKEWRPFWQGAPFYELDFSRDGQWVAFIQYPDHTLWKAKTDGSGRVQLTDADLEVHEPHWSPDGTRIAFMGQKLAGGEWRAQIVSAGGGVPEEAAPAGKGQGVPTWSPDGKAIIFGDRTDGKPGLRMNVHYVDLTTHKLSDVPNSYGLWSPRWSPDGKYIAAPSFDGMNLSILKWPGSEWKNILRLRAIQDVTWSADSRYLYFRGRKSIDCSELYRLKVADGTMETVVDLKSFRWALETWFGVTPQGTVLALYESSPQEIFAIDFKLR